MDAMIEVTGLQKAYGEVQAVKGLDFTVERGKLFAFLGPYGAGKSTTIDILCTILRPDAGDVLLDGHRLGAEDAAIRSTIGVVFQDHLLDPLLTVEENIRVRGGLYPHRRATLNDAVRRAAKAADVGDFLQRPYGKLSGGQKRRADIARALVHTPKILFLDEPTTGLDPQTRKGVWDSIRTLQKEVGLTVFLTTHYMEEAAEADDVVVIDDGRIAARGTPTALKEAYASDMLRITPLDEATVTATLAAANIAYTQNAGSITVRLNVTLDALPILEHLKGAISGFEVLNGTMDDAFIGITGREIRQ
ncbi:MAG TPA: ABC transporter ATP-binding protein [Candidatus Limiplasma sp.]|nr:ABC transporter ATP-binding protein [Candidatus Limiplasma sp.]HPS81472.1 ABC transporter ATP-binding protein [Candidatus Limiplasma sp.]